MPVHRRPITTTLAVVLLVLSGIACAKDEREAGDAFLALAREQSLTESYVVLLKTLGQDDFRGYADGIRLYARARAEFDGLIRADEV